MNVTGRRGDVVYSGHRHMLSVVAVTAKQQSNGEYADGLVSIQWSCLLR